MKKIVSSFIIIAIVFLFLCSCESAEEYYVQKTIRVKVRHVSCFEVYDEYDLYFDGIKRDQKYDLPSGKVNPSYKVLFTVTDISEDGVTIAFSQPMDKIVEDGTDHFELDQLSFVLREDNPQTFATPTDGGGDVFIFSIIDKRDAPTDKQFR